jgi:hypothetical protein
LRQAHTLAAAPRQAESPKADTLQQVTPDIMLTAGLQALSDRIEDLPVDDGSGLTVLGDVAVKLRDLSAEHVSGVPIGSADFATSLIKIRIAGARTDRTLPTRDLVQRRYAQRGYDLPLAVPDPNLYTVAAYDQGQLAGTVGVRLDSERGLYADELYPAELDQLRTRKLGLCEFTRLAVDTDSLSRTVLASLFHTAYLYAHRLRGVDAAVIEVNPRHVPFYMRALNFGRVGPERHNDRVDAPAVLLFVRFSTIRDGIAKYAGKPDLANTTRTLYPYGFSPLEEEGILNRLRNQDVRRNGGTSVA